MFHDVRLHQRVLAVFTAAMFCALPYASSANDGLKYDACPTPQCGGKPVDPTPGRDDRYTNMQINGAMAPVDNTQAVDTLYHWFDPDKGTYTAPVGKDTKVQCVPGTTAAPGTPCPLDPGTQGAMPDMTNLPKGMPTKNTPAISLVATFPWLFKDIDPTAQYKLYRGTGNNVFEAVSTPVNIPPADEEDVDDSADDQTGTGVDSVDVAALNNSKCAPITNSCGSDPASLQVWTRLQYDSCSNQYILSLAKTPSMVFDEGYRGHQYPWNESLCQPLKLSPVSPSPLWFGSAQQESQISFTSQNGKTFSGGSGTLYDYPPEFYLTEAWNGVLGSSYKPNGGTSDSDEGLPPYATGPINAPTGLAAKTFSTTLNDLTKQPYERIWDPTHPFSPRWDFYGNDRDYSIMARLTGGESLGVPGVGYDPVDLNKSNCIVRCAAVPVDILSFRASEFQQCMTCRIMANTECFWQQVFAEMVPIHILYVYNYDGETMSDAYKLTLNNEAPTVGPDPWMFWLTPLACKSMLDVAGLWPPCSTKYDHPNDNMPPMCTQCVLASGDINPFGGVKKCCNDLAHALAPINTLKIRNLQENPEIAPTPEGYSFKEYFSGAPMDNSTGSLPVGAATLPLTKTVVHMPYMRWWDTGTAAGGSSDSSGAYDYNPDCDKGKDDVIVGVGKEGKSCRYGGGAGLGYNNDCIKIPNPDALTSWSELKQYQMNTMRNYGMNCLAQYDKIYKPSGTEDGALFASGGYFNSPIAKIKPDGTTDPSKPYQMKVNPWPLGWRGYLSDMNFPDRFPGLNSTGNSGSSTYTGVGAQHTGLDNAQVGDIIFLTHADAENYQSTQTSTGLDAASANVMPFIAVVTGVQRSKIKNVSACPKDANGNPTACATSCSDTITITDINNGKYPDVCGNTNYVGMGQTRTIYKEWLPTKIYDVVYGTGPTQLTSSCGETYTPVGAGSGLTVNNYGSCSDPKMSVCTYYDKNNSKNLWDLFEVYRPTKDVRLKN